MSDFGNKIGLFRTEQKGEKNVEPKSTDSDDDGYIFRSPIGSCAETQSKKQDRQAEEKIAIKI